MTADHGSPADRSVEARRTLGVRAGAGSEEIRAAYLAQIQEHPPEREPEHFERIRDAYHHLSDPKRVALDRLFDAAPLGSVSSLLEALPEERRFVGPQRWLRVLKEGKP